jgi:hypothetical protein
VSDKWALFGIKALEFVERYAPTKLQLLGMLVLLAVVYRLPVLLEHRREMRVVRNEFTLRSNRHEAKIAAELAKRKQKSQKGVGK